MTLDLSYLLDFQALVDAGSFSRAAVSRNMTQPAFSRRIKALEQWAGAPLFHRGTSPATLTEAGFAMRPEIEQALASLAQAQMNARAAASRAASALHFAATHVLSFSFFPSWLRSLEGGQPLEAVQLTSDSLSACEHLIQQGRVQLLLCHSHEAAPPRLDPSRFVSTRVGADTLSLVAAPETDGAPRFFVGEDDPGDAPYLGYSDQSGLGRIVAAAMPRPYAGLVARAVFRSHLAAALRSMALTGRGVAWLPQSLMADDLAQGRLKRAGPKSLDIPVGIYLFRPIDRLGEAAEEFWARLTRPAVLQRRA